jgi:uncharacterized membrane protein
MVFAAWQVKRLAELLIAKEAGWYAVVPFVCAPDVMSFATNARSYGLALTASLISFRYLLEWQRDGGKKNAACVCFVISLSALPLFIWLSTDQARICYRAPVWIRIR